MGELKKRLTAAQQARKASLEEIVKEGQYIFLKVATALWHLKEEKLWADEYDTWTEYCEGKLGFSRQHVNRLIGWASVAADVEPTGSTPETERQARPLAGLPPDMRREVWTEAVESSPDGQPTGEHVGELVQDALDQLAANDPAAHQAVMDAGRRAPPERTPATRHGPPDVAGRAKRIAQAEGHLRRAHKLLEGLGGDEAEPVLQLIEAAQTACREL